jgi:hypothetical protein
MRRLRLSIFVVLAAAVSLAAGCKGNCRQLSEKQCECSLTPLIQQNCLTVAGQNEGLYSPTADDEKKCGALLKSCQCQLIGTPEGKKACGLAR